MVVRRCRVVSWAAFAANSQRRKGARTLAVGAGLAALQASYRRATGGLECGGA